MKRNFRFDPQYVIIVLFLVFSAVTLFSVALTKVTPAGDLTSYNPDVFNLINYTPITLWVGIFCLCGLFVYLFTHPKGVSSVFADRFMFLIMLVVISVFFGLPYFVEPNPRFVDSWLHGQTAKNILETGFITPQKESIYLAYPLSFTFISILSTVANIDLVVCLRLLPVFFTLVFFTFLTMLFNKIVNDLRISVIAVCLFALSTFYFAFHFSPEMFGWFFFLMLFAFLAKDIMEFTSGKLVSKSDSLTIMFLVVAIALSHPVTQFTVLLILFTLFTLGIFVWKINYVSSKLLLFATIVFLGWAMYFAYLYLDVIVEGFGNAFQRISLDLSNSIAARPLLESTPNEVAEILFYRRFLYIFVPLIGVLGGFLHFRRHKHAFKFLFAFLGVSLLMMSFTVFGILPLERPIKIAFLPLSLFAAVFMVNRRKLGVLLLVFFLFTIPINFSSYYWGEASTMTHDWELNSAEFVSANLNGTLLGEFKTTQIMKYYGNFSKVVNDYSLYGERPNIFNLTFIDGQRANIVYITQLTVQRQANFGFTVDMGTFLNSSDFICVHSNGYSTVFLKRNSTIPILP